MKNATYLVILTLVLIIVDTLIFIFTDLDTGMYIVFVIDSILFVLIFWYFMKKKKQEKEKETNDTLYK